MIPARLSVITVGARDIDKLRDFYKALGWPAVIEMEGDITVFQLSGALLTLFSVDKLAADADASPADQSKGIGSSLASVVDGPEQVDEAIKQAKQAGARITKEPVQTEWGGRSAYFADPEDNYWEVVWLPPDSKMAKAVRKAGG